MSRLLELEIDARKHPTLVLQEIKEVLQRHPGRDPLLLKARMNPASGGTANLRFGDDLRVDGADQELHAELEQVTGARPHFVWESG